MVMVGENITLRPLQLEERIMFFKWATRSDATPYWYGELYHDEVPSYIVFKHEWPDYYFNHDQPQKGRCFAILLQDRPIGQINYNEIHPEDNSTELDIIIAKTEDQNKGFGPEAIRILTHYLFDVMCLNICRAEILHQNPRAISAYKKAGFQSVRKFMRDGLAWEIYETCNT